MHDYDDGYFERCFVVQAPHSLSQGAAPRPLPIVFFFHGEADGAGGCGWRPDHSNEHGGLNLAEAAYQNGVALVCIESVSYEGSDAGAVNVSAPASRRPRDRSRHQSRGLPSEMAG